MCVLLVATVTQSPSQAFLRGHQFSHLHRQFPDVSCCSSLLKLRLAFFFSQCTLSTKTTTWANVAHGLESFFHMAVCAATILSIKVLSATLNCPQSNWSNLLPISKSIIDNTKRNIDNGNSNTTRRSTNNVTLDTINLLSV